MNVVVFASRKGGTGKSTLTAHLSAQAAKPSRRTLLIDADPQGSLSLWHELRGAEQPSLKRAMRGIDDVVKAAKREGYEWFRARRGRRSEGVRPGFARSGRDRESVERDRALGEGHQRGA
jgi:CO dehydrogenase nickel-insertion accessory protein CooC1